MGNNSAEHPTDIVIVSWNHQDLTNKCIGSIYKNTDDEAYNLIHVDNGTKINWRDLETPFDYTAVFLQTNTGYCHGTNVGLAMSLLSDSEYVLLLNNDCEIPKGDTTWLERMITPMRDDEKVGAVGAVSDTVFGYQKRSPINSPREGITHVPSLIGFCQLIRKTALEQVGLLDERFDPDGNYSDFDYSIRLVNAGWKMAIAESVWIHHVGSVTQKDLDYNANLQRNYQKLAQKWDAAQLKAVGL